MDGTKEASIEKNRSNSLSLLVDIADKEMKLSDQRQAFMIRNYFKQANKFQAGQNPILQMYGDHPHLMMTPFNPYMMNDVTKVKPKKKKRGRKRKREIPPPKKAMSAYNVFFKETRVKLLEEFEKITFEQLGKEVGKRWHKLSTKERVPYQKRSRLDKERFKKEMEEYKVKLALKEKMMEQNKINMLPVEASDVSQVPRTSPVLVEATGSTVSSGSEDISPRGSEDISPRFDEEGGDDLRDPALT
eukprot:g2291.t1